MTWHNEANVRVTSGFDENKWVSANYVAKITGLLYNDLRGTQARALACVCDALVSGLLLAAMQPTATPGTWDWF